MQQISSPCILFHFICQLLGLARLKHCREEKTKFVLFFFLIFNFCAGVWVGLQSALLLGRKFGGPVSRVGGPGPLQCWPDSLP